jgi:hypothetical protein
MSERPVKDIANELGYDNPNLISMFRSGAVKVPLTKIPVLAKALHADPSHLLRLALADYQPDWLETIDATLGPADRDERELLAVHRSVTKGRETRLPAAFFEGYRALLRQHLAS